MTDEIWRARVSASEIRNATVAAGLTLKFDPARQSWRFYRAGTLISPQAGLDDEASLAWLAERLPADEGVGAGGEAGPPGEL